MILMELLPFFATHKISGIARSCVHKCLRRRCVKRRIAPPVVHKATTPQHPNGRKDVLRNNSEREGVRERERERERTYLGFYSEDRHLIFSCR